MSAQIRHILDDANMDDEDIMRIMSIVQKQEEELQELQSQLEDDTRQVHQLFAENEKLKQKTAEHLGMAETLHDAVVEENNKLKEKLNSIQNAIKDVL